jgi:hypothetical protein
MKFLFPARRQQHVLITTLLTPDLLPPTAREQGSGRLKTTKAIR